MTAALLPTEIRRLDLAAPDGACDATLALPREEGAYPGVLFLMDAIGLRPQIDAMTERIASWGYVVLAPNLFYRTGRAPVVELPDLMVAENREAFFGSVMPIMRAFTPEIMVRDAGAYLEALSDLAPGPVGVTGYCLGGRMALLTAAAYPDRVAAVASFHGGNLATEDAGSPHLGVGRIRGEVYVGHADHDGSAPLEQQERLERALDEANVPHRTELYPDAPHGFTMADTAMYQAEGAERHDQRLADLLARNLKG